MKSQTEKRFDLKNLRFILVFMLFGCGESEGGPDALDLSAKDARIGFGWEKPANLRNPEDDAGLVAALNKVGSYPRVDCSSDPVFEDGMTCLSTSEICRGGDFATACFNKNGGLSKCLRPLSDPIRKSFCASKVKDGQGSKGGPLVEYHCDVLNWYAYVGKPQIQCE